jgi:enoyl-CoA hydratase/carnithine racemase
MLYTGRIITGREALDRGLVSAIAPAGGAVEMAMKIAADVAEMPPLALAQLKDVLGAAQDVPLSQGLKLERNAFQVLFASEDQKAGMRAFLNKAKPVFVGR